jgi:hypothetical protein
MKHRIQLVSILLILVVSLTACSAATPPAPTPTEDAVVVLEVVGSTETKQFTLTDLQQLPNKEGYAGIKSSTGKITLPAVFTGVSLFDLVNLAGSFDQTMGVELMAVAGYAMTISYNQVMNGDFIAYDPGTGDETQSGGTLQPILAYQREGKLLDPQTDGYLRLMIISEKNNQVTDGHWSVKWVTKVTVKPLSREWNLYLEGQLIEEMDRGTFESGANPGCHGATFTDTKSQQWNGIALWLLVGRVDDETRHDGPAFNDTLVDTGYTVEVVSADGSSVTFDAKRVARNDNLIIANSMNSNPLNDADFPLKLVGSDVQENEGLGMIVSIIIHFVAP